MADEEVDMSPSAPGSAARRSNGTADRRTPRFSWNAAYEDTFFRSLCESMQMGLKENHSFKAGAWERAAIALRDKHAAYPEKSHLINKADNARKKFRMWRGLREDPDFLYNPNTKMVTAPDEAWKQHCEKEPLSRALRGRPFEHEQYMEILFPDVVGSGGAPKRIMRPRRKTADGTYVHIDSDPESASNTPVSDARARRNEGSSASQAAAIDPQLDAATYNQTPTRPAPPASAGAPAHSDSQTQVHTAATTSTNAPVAAMAANSSALTPPDEQNPQSQPRKRPNPDPAPGQPGEKRRGRPSRFSANFYTQPNSGLAATPVSHQTPAPTNAAPRSGIGSFNSAGLHEEGAMAEFLRSRSPPKWQEQAVEILFRDFSDEDADLQLKIAEKPLGDEHKAMLFVKMTPVLRQHWVGRLREVHMRNLGGGLGRVGDEAA